ncbi:RdgB/HAM1 family non-canonical purine NTP pyrophosphatase [Spirochaetia bacterium 38H-sp]|uniref:dITP/XTP pyrophosphatase n=1 Tax=Rarispira pelagica TaxID=3141764 RepID=A0ABU9UFP2_9SPIR
MQIILASNNQHKKEELGKILYPHTILLPQDMGISFSCEETGKTYIENAIQKAQTLYKQIEKPVLSDDSGLSVEALDGRPGIHSARFGEQETGKKLNQKEKNRLLLELMGDKKERKAAFVCCMVLFINPLRIYAVQETLEGYIATEERGTNGFGYDPIFYLPQYDKHLAELSPEEKNKISHRGKAAKRISKLLEDI